jgi:hypothetical protein
VRNRPLVAAALLGLGGGLRSFAPPVTLAISGRGPLAGPARFIAFGAAAGELIADKQPQMSSRLAPPGLALRLGFSSSGGRDSGGWQGAGVAAVAALAAMFAGSWLRGKVHGRPAGSAGGRRRPGPQTLVQARSIQQATVSTLRNPPTVAYCLAWRVLLRGLRVGRRPDALLPGPDPARGVRNQGSVRCTDLAG